jgi:SAM-dependent methyltransferase
MTSRDEHIAEWKHEEQQPFAGWDFSYLDGRMLEDQPPWSYLTRAGELLQQAKRTLDMGTGGGERLLELRAQWPRALIASEDYAPNVLLAARRLTPHGASVVAARVGESDTLPFANGTFDVVLNRHSGIHAQEVARVLASSGVFYTQQIHGLWAFDLLSTFGASPQWPDATPQRDAPLLEAAGLTVTHVDEWSGRLRFTDVGAIVYYLKAVPWLVPGFSVDTHLDALLRLQARLDRGESLVFLIRKYVIEAARSP